MTALKNIASLIGGAGVLAAATIGLVQPAVSQAERSWDLKVYGRRSGALLPGAVVAGALVARVGRCG